MNVFVDDKEFEPMIDYDQIKKQIRLIAIQLNIDYENTCPLFIGVLNGSFMFMADLLKEVKGCSEISFVKVSSYEGDSSTGKVKQLIGLEKDIRGREIIIVEDIVDTGLTIRFLIAELRKHEPASISVCTLLLKPEALQGPVDELAYVAFEIPNEFVVGYGLDYNGLGRNLRNIYKVV
jgi:hypoxanthine phosphoribosyltransferase